MKLAFLFMPITSLAMAIGGCAAATPPGSAAITDLDKVVQLPATFEKVLFRTEEVQPSVVLLGYVAKGVLIVKADAIVFKHEDGEITVAAESAQFVTSGRLAGTAGRVWLGVGYTEGGALRFAAFAGFPSFMGGPSDADLYGAVRAMLLPGKSTANALLERDTFRQMIAMDRAVDQDCFRRRVVNREIVSNGATEVTEDWILDRCGTLVRYRIGYLPSSGGGTLIRWTPEEVIGKVQAR